MLMAGVAFGCSDILMVGQEQNLQRMDSFPASFSEAVKKGQIRFRRFKKWKDCVAYIMEQTIYLIGVEIDETSQPLNNDYFEKSFPVDQNNIGILLGNG